MVRPARMGRLLDLHIFTEGEVGQSNVLQTRQIYISEQLLHIETEVLEEARVHVKLTVP